MVRIADIAKEMNLSEATVSNALSGGGRMKPETREAVVKRAQELGYTPVLRNSRKKPQGNLIVIAEDVRNAFVSRILEGIRRESEKEGLFLPVYSFGVCGDNRNYNPDINDISRAVRSLMNSLGTPPTGAIYVAQYSRLITELMADMPFPTVFVFCTRESGVPFVHYDDKQGAYLAVNHLVDSGRRNIAMISGPIDSIGMICRTSGYQRALVDRGIAFDPLLMRIGNWTMDSGYTVTRSLLKENGRIDSIFAQNDYMALGALHAIREHGLRVPEDISIIGFDNNSYVANTSMPKLSSVNPPFEAMGSTACRTALNIQEKKPAETEGTFIPCTLVHRETTICAGGINP